MPTLRAIILIVAVISTTSLTQSCRESTTATVTIAFLTQPTVSMAGRAITPAVQVVIRDGSGRILTGATDRVTIALGANPAGGTLGGTSTVTPAGGVATFSTLSIDNPGAGYTLTATADGLPGATSTPFDVTGFTSVSAGGLHTCALTPDGAAFCWGDNSTGELGDGSTASSSTPVPVSGGLIFAALSAGSDSGHTCGLTVDGAAYCWGRNDYGQLGNVSVTGSTTPVPVSGGLTFSAVTAGWNHSCGVTTSGAAYCWGSNGGGELGNGTNNGGPTPVAVSGGLTFAALSAGNFLTCGVTTSATAYCWGVAGRLGNGLRVSSSVPVAVAGGLTFAGLSAASHTCAVTRSGTAYCWGWNSDGQLGDGSTDSSSGYERLAPVQVEGGLTFATVTTGFWFTCGLNTAKAAYCWGTDSIGQLGIGSTTGPQQCYTVACSTTPVAVSGAYGFVAVSGGNGHACGLTPDGVIYCWGENSRGQLGDGSTTNSSTPARVKNP